MPTHRFMVEPQSDDNIIGESIPKTTLFSIDERRWKTPAKAMAGVDENRMGFWYGSVGATVEHALRARRANAGLWGARGRARARPSDQPASPAQRSARAGVPNPPQQFPCQKSLLFQAVGGRGADRGRGRPIFVPARRFLSWGAGRAGKSRADRTRPPKIRTRDYTGWGGLKG